MIQGIDHVAMAVRSIEEHLSFYRDVLGLASIEIETVAEQKVRVALIRVGGSTIELLEPIAEDSPLTGFLERRGEGMHHVALATDDIEGDIRRYLDLGVQMIDQTPRAGAGGARIAFIHPRSAGGVLTELCQRSAEK